MNLTINTDASYYQEQQVGGFAFWAKSNVFTYKYSGPIKSPANPNDCEAKAIANALYMISKRVAGMTFERLFINTDSLHTINKIKQRKKDEKAIEFILEAAAGLLKGRVNKNSLIVRHVKAHSHTNTPRNYINDWCDRMAKMEAKKQML